MAHDLTFRTGNSIVLAAANNTAGNVQRSARAIVARELDARRLAGGLAWAGFALLVDRHTITDCGELQDQHSFHGVIIQSFTDAAVETITVAPSPYDLPRIH
jgi:hypothetical protein